MQGIQPLPNCVGQRGLQDLARFWNVTPIQKGLLCPSLPFSVSMEATLSLGWGMALVVLKSPRHHHLSF